ncbi:hypothetical protein [Candidatus Tisiphia endosymbiont of Parasteatoda lunata]|uniref:hypothetical protein n=1 Tax=Candidatus Tisiphia endosymbiont of Parasteatoda lunata TaxID=3066275 RepID=UPI00313E8DC9
MSLLLENFIIPPFLIFKCSFLRQTQVNINKATISSIKKAHEPTLKTSPVSTSNQALQQNINFLPFQLLNSIDTDPVAAPKQNHYICHIIKPNGTKLIIQTLEPKTIIQTFLCCN